MPFPVALVKPSGRTDSVPLVPDLFLLHWDPPYHHASHYLGYAKGLGRGAHYADQIARGVKIGPHELVMAAQQAGCVIQVADVFVGASRPEQRRMRANGSLSRFCPICRDRGVAHL